jgi:NADH-quinone oxidoreductase subunit C
MSKPTEQAILDELRTQFQQELLEAKVTRDRRIFIEVSPRAYKPVMDYIVRTMGFTHLSTMTGLDSTEGFEIMPHLSRGGAVLTVKVRVGRDNPMVETITDLIPGATLYEREIHDLVGVVFRGHPNLERLILYEGWPEGVHPLRKEYKAVQPEPLRRV